MKPLMLGLMAGMIIAPATFAGADVVLKSSEDILGAKIGYPAGQAEITGVIATLKPGQCNGWHSHPVPTFGLLRTGDLTVTYAGGAVRQLKPGDMLIEAQHTPHEGCNTGESDLEILVFYAGAEGLVNTKQEEREAGH